MAKRKAADEPMADVSTDNPADLFGAPTEEPKEEPVAETSAETTEATPEPTETVEPVQEAEPAPPSEPKRFKLWDGSEITAEELAKRPDLVEDLVQTRHQFPHLQKKYMEILEASRAATAPAQPAATQAPSRAPSGPERPAFSLDSWKQTMQPMVDEFVQKGVITKDDLDFAPGLVYMVANLLQDYWQMKNAALDAYEHQIRPALQLANTVTTQAENERVWSQINNRLNEVQSRGEFFSGLADPNERQKFIQYLAEAVNPEMEAILGDRAAEFLSAQYVGYRRDPLLQAVSTASRQRSADAQQVRRSTSGESSAPSARQKAPGANNDIMELFGRG